MKSSEMQIDTHAYYVMHSVSFRESKAFTVGGGRKVEIVKLSIFEFPKELCM